MAFEDGHRRRRQRTRSQSRLVDEQARDAAIHSDRLQRTGRRASTGFELSTFVFLFQ